MESPHLLDEDLFGFALETADLDELTDLLAQLEASRAACACSTFGLRLRTQTNDTTHFVRQCLTCGRQRGGAVSKDAALTELNGTSAVAFDETVNEDYVAARLRSSERIGSVRDRIQEITGGAAGEDDEARAQRMRREESVSRLKDALANLTAVCGEQGALHFASAEYGKFRRRAWENSFASFERFRSEPELRGWLEGWLEQDFDVFREVPGVHPSGNGVQVDYLIYPKPHLISLGFCERHVSVEAKYLNQREGFARRASRAMWQTISYTQSTFSLDGNQVRPAFGLLFSNLSFEDERARLKVLNEFYNDLAQWRALRQLANHAAVGVFEMRGSRSNHTGWKLDFAGGTYFSRTDDFHTRLPVYRLSDRNTAEKVRTGNF